MMNNWRQNLLWRTDIIDIEYWLNYADGHPPLNQWGTDASRVCEIAITEWNENSDYQITLEDALKIENFAKEFIINYGKINGEIIHAYITQGL